MHLYEEVGEYIQSQDLLGPHDRVVVGFSGGADSLTLLDVLHRLGYEVIAAHLDHQLRASSGEDLEFCRQVALKWGIPFSSKRVDVARFAQDEGYSLEEAARQVRYRFLAEVAKDADAQIVATGHTIDDQVETLLLHFLRGAGPAGLAGMRAKSDLAGWPEVPNSAGLSLVRPLLETRRLETEAHCHAMGIAPLIDPTNQDPIFLRNRIRSELLPLMEDLRPGVAQVLLRTSKLMRGLEGLLESLVADSWGDTVRSVGEDALALQAGTLSQMPLALQRAFVRKAHRELRPKARDLGLEHVERVLSLLDGEATGRIPLVGDVEAALVGADLLLYGAGAELDFPTYPQLVRTDSLCFRPGDSLGLRSGWRLEAERVDLPEELRESLIQSGSPWQAALDADRLADVLTVRGPSAGDRIWPLGMRGSVKLSDLFINEGIPRLVRKRWPVLLSESEIVWVPGLRLAHAYRIRPSTKHALLLRATQIGAEQGDESTPANAEA